MTLIKQNEKIVYSEETCNYDVIIKCSDGDICTHRMILGAVSTWFREMITVSDTDELILTIMMKDFQSNDIISFLDFVNGKQDVLVKNVVFYDLHIDVMFPSNTIKSPNIKDYGSSDNNKVELEAYCEPIWNDDSSNDIKTEEIKVKEEAFDGSMEVDDFYSDLRLDLEDAIDFEPKKLRKDRKKVTKKKKKNKTLVPTLMNIECKMCSLSFTEQESFAQHCREKHDFNYSCDLCQFISKKRMDSLIHHRARAHGIGEDIKCKVCDYTSKLKYDMLAHVKRMHSGISYQCDKCDYKASEKINLKKHIAARHENVIYHCDQCTYTAVHKNTVLQHKLKIHDGLVENWACDQCDVVLSTKQHLNNHIAAKHGEKTFLCDKCDYKSAVKDKLKLHVRYHHEDFMFKCKECDFSCKGKTTLYNHKKKVHEGAVYSCDDCDHIASTAGKLREHRVRKHGDYSQFKCEYCGHRTSLQCNLLKHMKDKHEGYPFTYPLKFKPFHKKENQDNSE